MTEEEIVEEYSGSPFDDYDLAQLVTMELPKDSPAFKAATRLSNALDNFYDVMADIGYEFG